MSLVSTLRPVGLSFNSPMQNSISEISTTEVPLQSDLTYLQLHRTLTRYQNLILLIPSPASQNALSGYELTPPQRRIRAELYSGLPYHRTKWLRSIESARNVLLTLERQAQNIKSPRVKKDALRDLAGKRQIIKRLKSRVEEIGREVETAGASKWIASDQDEKLLGERADAVLAKMGRDLDSKSIPKNDSHGDLLKEGQPVTQVFEDSHDSGQSEHSDRDALFGSSVRRRQGQSSEMTDIQSSDRGTTSGFSNLGRTEQSLQTHAREHEDLTSALVSMAAQLKQQSRAFQFSLGQDEQFLKRAVEGLDFNLTSMEAASKNMAFLRRMSEEQGWLGRLKLYAIILGLWVFAVLLVFVGPKLRF